MGVQFRQRIDKRTTTSPLKFAYLKTPKGYVFAVLSVLTLLAMLHRQDAGGLRNVLIGMGTAVVVDGTVAILQRRKKWFSDGGLVTGLLVADILNSNTAWYEVVVITALALTSKHVLKVGRKPIFNPAAVGLLFALMLFHSGQSWWGSLSMLPWWCAIFLLVGGLLVAQRVKKVPQTLAFLGTYFTLLLLFALLHIGLPSDSPGDALRAPFVNSALYLAFFMLTDPPTSPPTLRHQVFFGFFAAAVGVTFFAVHGGLSYLLIGLLAANVWKAWVSRRPKSPTR
jgi:Na+-translocating ferredoxin:NAD+ oxidoreductase RnfD subunit